MCTIEVQVPRPVCVVVPPTAFELRKKEEHRSAGIYLETWSGLTVLPAILGFSHGKTQTSVPMCADGSVILHEETHRVQEVSVTFSLSCGKLSKNQNNMTHAALWAPGLQLTCTE